MQYDEPIPPYDPDQSEPREFTYAIVQDGRVINRALSIAPMADDWIESDTAAVGDLYDADTGTFSKPVIPVTREGLLQAVTDKRWEVMTGGIELPGGISVGTSIDDQNRITSVVANAELAGLSDEDYVDFKAASGWVLVTIGQIKAIAGSIGQFVQACYTAERAHYDDIGALDDTELQDYDITTGWPPNEPQPDTTNEPGDEPGL